MPAPEDPEYDLTPDEAPDRCQRRPRHRRPLPGALSRSRSVRRVAARLRLRTRTPSCVREASGPDGVWHGSPAGALHVGHGRERHPRATWSPVGGLAVPW
jgi:hypothetical protein